MSNKKLYQDTFSQVRFKGEIDPARMAQPRKKAHVFRKTVLVAAAVCLLAGVLGKIIVVSLMLVPQPRGG